MSNSKIDNFLCISFFKDPKQAIDYTHFWNQIVHVSTSIAQERRLKAVAEILRVLKPGGFALIYVWAFEQSLNGKRAVYLKKVNDVYKNDVETSSIAADSPKDDSQQQQQEGVNIHEKIDTLMQSQKHVGIVKNEL